MPEHKKVNCFAYKKSMGHLNSKTHWLSVDSDSQVTTVTESRYLKNFQGRQLQGTLDWIQLNAGNGLDIPCVVSAG